MKHEFIFSILWSFLPVIILSSIILLLFVVFLFKILRHGVPKSPRIQAEGKSIFLSKFFMEFWVWAVRPVVLGLSKLRLHPDAITVVGCLIGAGAGLALCLGSFVAGGWLILLAGTFDMLDGSVARMRGMVSKAGAYLDSNLDRYTEFFAFAGLLFYYRTSPFLLVVFLAVIGSSMVSYARARGEGLGVGVRLGAMQRTERILYLGVGTAFAPILSVLIEPNAVHPFYPLALAAIFLIAIFANVTAMRRMLFTYRTLRNNPPTPTAPVCLLPSKSSKKNERMEYDAQLLTGN